MTDHCPACQVARELRAHRDATAADWSVRRGTLNFAVIVAAQACPDYVAPERGEVGTGAGGVGDPAQTEATLWVNRSVDCPEAPAQAHLPAEPESEEVA